MYQFLGPVQIVCYNGCLNFDKSGGMLAILKVISETLCSILVISCTDNTVDKNHKSMNFVLKLGI